jgi:hypothetical protein
VSHQLATLPLQICPLLSVTTHRAKAHQLNNKTAATTKITLTFDIISPVMSSTAPGWRCYWKFSQKGGAKRGTPAGHRVFDTIRRVEGYARICFVVLRVYYPAIQSSHLSLPYEMLRLSWNAIKLGKERRKLRKW